MVTYLSEDKKLRRASAIIFLLLVPVVLFLIPMDWVKNHHSICIYKNITGHECYGCGMTRAVLSAIHLKFAEAFHFNKLFIIVLPLLAGIWAKKLVSLWPQKQIT